jgi:hypothetical protein
MFLTGKDKHWLRVKGCKNIFEENGSPKQGRGTTFIFDKTLNQINSY